jgi:hypothetical protein
VSYFSKVKTATEQKRRTQDFIPEKTGDRGRNKSD